jgi:hypothetical protein
VLTGLSDSELAEVSTKPKVMTADKPKNLSAFDSDKRKTISGCDRMLNCVGSPVCLPNAGDGL